MRLTKVVFPVVAMLVVASAAQAVTFKLNMTGAKEPNGAGQLGFGDPDGLGVGTLTLDPVADTVSWNLVYSNLDGAAVSGFHIHGPNATPTTNVGVYIGFPLSSTAVPNGLQFGTLTTANIADLGTRIDAVLANPAGFYTNLHTSGTGGFPGGAIRTQLPEPGSMALLGVGSLLLARRRRTA